MKNGEGDVEKKLQKDKTIKNKKWLKVKRCGWGWMRKEEYVCEGEKQRGKKKKKQKEKKETCIWMKKNKIMEK